MPWGCSFVRAWGWEAAQGRPGRPARGVPTLPVPAWGLEHEGSVVPVRGSQPRVPNPRVQTQGSQPRVPQSGGPCQGVPVPPGGALRAWPSRQAPPLGQSRRLRISRALPNPAGSWPRPEPISDGLIEPQPISVRCLLPSPLHAPTNQSAPQNPLRPPGSPPITARPVAVAQSAPPFPRSGSGRQGAGWRRGGGGGTSLPVPSGRRSGARPGRAGPGAMGE